MPDETLVAADGTPIVHVPRLSQALTQALSDIDQAKAAAKTAVHAQASKQGDPSVVPGVVLDAATLAQLAHMQSREDVLTAGLAAHEENTKLELQRMRDDYDAKKAEQRGQMLDELERAAPRADAPISDVELQVQSAKLDALSAKWEKREKEVEYAESLRSGWGPSPERINGRFAMFFLIVGLITEYYTGQSVPQQCYTMLQTLSIVD
ncbi:high light induced protein 2 [Chrysochromulina tobinii]|uniref:High light induced protein 2 n=1 Tax=Chrysochromulina tobinii TaxID=1460289 RepID=A0A0M0JH27_9EUKA|nr:high light induced protein 2 [Chrysochromulina tobinii]|eukprot:KOO25775.1 high light induced protein 2 [Chrysochromulina sp. CCMP291]